MRLAAAVVALTGAAVAATMASRGGGDSPAARSPAAQARFPEPVKAAFTPGPPVRLAPGERWHYAPVRRAVVARAAPSADAPAVETVPTRTPEGTDDIVQVIARRAPWVRVRLVNSRTGWVPRAALGGYATVTTRLDVDLRALRATLYRDGRPVFSAPVGVGAPGTPTPAGRFYVRNRLARYRSPEYGPVAFGTSAQSASVTDWPAGGYVGIHGTDRPDLLPGRVSHGCIRLRNPDILRLAAEMPIGTPVVVH
jgi:lipoprotein-anchoring transpeptidase ErfK/SrfK